MPVLAELSLAWVSHSTACNRRIRINRSVVLTLLLLGALHFCIGCGYYTSVRSPEVRWSDPATVVYGTLLGPVQLNATASVAGAFQYSPAAGSLLEAGSHSLSATFMPADRAHYSVVTTSVTMRVEKAAPSVSWAPPEPISLGTPLSSTQLNATASIPGFFTYVPKIGTVLNQGAQVLSVIFTPTDNSNYSAVTVSVQLAVKPVPVSLSLQSEESSSVVGNGTKLVATALYSDETSADVTNLTKFTAMPDRVAQVTNAGEANCLRRGTAQITAQFGSVSASTNLICTQLVHQQPFSTLPDEFVGPFSSWYNLKSDFGAIGDGVTDDTVAIQKALDALKPGWAGGTSVLWVPTGTYQISGTLNLIYKDGISIIGEDPEKTTLVWRGMVGGNMIFCSGVARSRLLRFRLDGSNTADTGIYNFFDGHTGLYPADNLVTDATFQNMNRGIRVGFAGPTLVERVRFIDVAFPISTEDWNAGEVWIRDSTFSHSQAAITNIYGAGQFHVYGSVFLDSAKADMYIKNTQFFSARGNTSVGSNAFLIADPAGNNGANFVIQDNLVVDTATTPITVGNRGPLMLIDNTILLPQDSALPVIRANDFGSISTDIMTMGNVFTTSNVMAGNVGRSHSIDDQVVRRSEFSVQRPEPAPFLANSHRKVVEIPSNWTAAQIQQALDVAASERGSRDVLHFPAGIHPISQSLTISGGSDVQLIGDGLHSSLLWWLGPDSAPLLSIQNPARATLRDFDLFGSPSSTNIEVKVNDIPGSRVLLSGFESAGSIGAVSEGLDQAIIEARSTSVNPIDLGIKVIGGASGQSGATTFGGFRSFGGGDSSYSSDGYTYDIQKGGQLTIEDSWHDANWSSPNFVHLTDSGTLSLECGLYATPGPAAFSIDGFEGDVSLLGYQAWDVAGNGEIKISGDASQLRFLGFGVAGFTEAPSFFNNSAVGGDIGLVMSETYNTTTGVVPIPDRGKTDDDFVRRMFSHVRHLHTAPLLQTRPEQTDLRIQQVRVESNHIGIHLTPEIPSDTPVRSYAIESADGSAVLSVFDGQTLRADLRRSWQWRITHLDDGGYQLSDASSGLVLDSTLNLGTSFAAPSHSWLIEPVGDGNFAIRDSSGGLLLSLDAFSRPAMLPEGAGIQEWKLVPAF